MGAFDYDASAEDEMIHMIEKLGNTSEIAPRILKACAPPLVTAVKYHCSLHRRTGLMGDSVKQTKPKENQYGWMTCVRPTGKSTQYIDDNGKIHDRKGGAVRNMEILAHMEYGTSKQNKTPVLTAAVGDARNEVREAMQEEYNRIVAEAGG